MTLDTRIVIHDPIPPRKVFDFCRGLIGAGDVYLHEERRHQPTPEFAMLPGQGLPAWLIVYHSGDGPLARDPEWEDNKPEGFVEVSFDTAYSYHVNGAGCSDLHAWLVRELGQWLDDQGASWSWRNEFTGEWFKGADGLAEFGNELAGALR